MKKSKAVINRVQVTCLCRSYDFPHRINSGRCSGSAWANSYMEVCGELCELCNCKKEDMSCDVSVGQESITHCEGYQDHLHRQPIIRLPVSIDDYMNTVYELADEYNEDLI